MEKWRTPGDYHVVQPSSSRLSNQWMGTTLYDRACYSPFLAGLMHDDLKVFLMNNVPQGKKKSKVQLGVADTKLGAAIQESLNIICQAGV